MQIGDNYLNDSNLPPEIPRIGGRDSVVMPSTTRK